MALPRNTGIPAKMLESLEGRITLDAFGVGERALINVH